VSLVASGPVVNEPVRLSEAGRVSEAVATSLRGRVYVVAGGAGVAGECVVEALLRRSATVAAASRSPERLAALRAAHPEPGLHTYVAAMGSTEGVARLRDEVVTDLGHIDGTVASLGGWWEGPGLTELAERTWRELLDSHLTSHFAAAHGLLPALVDRPDSVYLMLNGIAADKAVAASGPVSVAGAAQRMLLRVLAAEFAGRAVRLHEVAVLTPIVTRHWAQGQGQGQVKLGWLSGYQVGEYVAQVLTPGFARNADLLLSIG
jgi:NAD(P)-dependent dehydrogenase (short-subunit alcohol dehydrogenase family)